MNVFKPIFIVGVGRSGTSMLQSMLNAHRDITFPPETHFIRSYLSGRNKLGSVKETILSDHNLLKLNLPLESIVERNNSLESFYKDLLQEYMFKQGKKYVGDKDPKNIEYLKLIHSVFPQAIIIHIYRDPRAVVASRIKAKWSQGRPLWQHLLAYKAQLAYGRQKGSKLFKIYIEIKYEKLLEETEEELKKICNMIELDYDPNMIEFYKSSADVVQGEEISWKQNCFNPVMLQNIDKWKDELSEEQIKDIEFVLDSEMELLDYGKIEDSTMFYKLKKQYYKLFIETVNMMYKSKLN
jgi:hypothetical protein